jgi:cell wall-associated NlpC family hydrolase
MRSHHGKRERRTARLVWNGLPAFAMAMGMGVAPARAEVPLPASNERRAERSMQWVQAREALQLRLERRKRAARVKAQKKWKKRSRRAVRFALHQRGKPYIWGGVGPRGYDCSGLMWRSWRKAGIQLPRTARAQYRKLRARGKRVPRRDLRAGDLVFFRNLRHVGMYIGNGRFVHAPRRGRAISVRRLDGYYRRTYIGGARPGWARAILGPAR